MNMYAGREASRASTIMRKPEDVRYIIYDFGYSSMYPAGIDMCYASDTRYLGFTHAPTPEGAYNPFKADVSMMAGLLFGFVMVSVGHFQINLCSLTLSCSTLLRRSQL